MAALAPPPALSGYGLAAPSLRDADEGYADEPPVIDAYGCCAGVVPFVFIAAVADSAAGSSFSFSTVGVLAPLGLLGAVLFHAGAGGVAVPPVPPPSLFAISIFKLLSSVPSSFRRLSLVSLAPSSAFGMPSLRLRTSSPILLDSSSRRLADVFNSETTDSTSRRATSRRSVRCSSAVFSAAVSVESWSRRENARVNCSSIEALSCSICGGVGGDIKGAT